MVALNKFICKRDTNDVTIFHYESLYFNYSLITSTLLLLFHPFIFSSSGNIVVWASIILGQPLAVMMYYHDYVITHFNEALKNSVI